MVIEMALFKIQPVIEILEIQLSDLNKSVDSDAINSSDIFLKPRQDNFFVARGGKHEQEFDF
jgi:hypothetical protein